MRTLLKRLSVSMLALAIIWPQNPGGTANWDLQRPGKVPTGKRDSAEISSAARVSSCLRGKGDAAER